MFEFDFCVIKFLRHSYNEPVAAPRTLKATILVGKSRATGDAHHTKVLPENP
jgi:hypothetical protein